MFKNLFSKNKSARATPDGSYVEIANTKKHLGTELRACLYLYNEEKFIISSIAGIAEYGEPALLDVNVSDENLGLTVCDKLLEFQPKNNKDISKNTLEDWLSYKASGAKTGKVFESNSIYVYIQTVNSAIIITASPRVTNNQTLKAKCSAVGDHYKIGAAIRMAIEASKTLRQAGLL